MTCTIKTQYINITNVYLLSSDKSKRLVSRLYNNVIYNYRSCSMLLFFFFFITADRDYLTNTIALPKDRNERIYTMP